MYKAAVTAGVVLGLAAGSGGHAAAAVDYSIDDGVAEVAIATEANEDFIWLNTFPVEPGAQWIDSISVAYGRAGIISAFNGQALKVLLYEDVNGGSPQDAVLKRSIDAVAANANTNTLNIYSFTPTEITGTLVVGVVYRNSTGVRKFPAALDTTAPTFAGRSYYGFAGAIDSANLGWIPAGQFDTIESAGAVGNFRIRAHGVPSPGACGVLALGAVMGQRRRR